MNSKAGDRGRRVNLLVLTDALHIGGAEMVVRELVRAIDRARFNVSVCCLKVLGMIGEGLLDDGIDIFRLPGSCTGRVDYLTAFKLRRVLKERRVGLVHSHTTHALVDAVTCKVADPRLKVVHTFHYGNYPHTRSRRILWMERVASRIADRLISVGTVQREQIKSVFRLGDDAVVVVPNGVRIPAPGDDGHEFRARLTTGEEILVGTLATLIEQKGLPHLLAVARRVRDAGVNARFVIVGEGPLRPELERLRHDLGLDEVVIIYGWVPDAAKIALPAFDVYFQPSLWEAMSISILEAMAAGRPVVATSVGETPLLIEHGAHGLLFGPGDVAGMAEGICRLAADGVERRLLGAAAARRVSDRFTVQHMTRAYEDLYLGVLEGEREVRHAAS